MYVTRRRIKQRLLGLVQGGLVKYIMPVKTLDTDLSAAWPLGNRYEPASGASDPCFDGARERQLQAFCTRQRYGSPRF